MWRRGMFVLGLSYSCHSKRKGPSAPQFFLVLPTNDHTFHLDGWHRHGNTCGSTGRGCVFRYQPLHKCIMRFVSDSWVSYTRLHHICSIIIICHNVMIGWKCLAHKWLILNCLSVLRRSLSSTHWYYSNLSQSLKQIEYECDIYSVKVKDIWKLISWAWMSL